MPSENLDPAARVRQRLDDLNAADPATVLVDGVARPSELVFADRLEAWVKRLRAGASPELLIATRGQHVRRWTIPRSTFPEGRTGYLRWREELKKMHAAIVSQAMRDEGFPDASVARAQAIVFKQFNRDPEAQVMEDALCLLFLETQLDALRTKTPDDKMADIVRKTWRKMSVAARQEALRLPLPADHLAFLQRALA